MLDYATEAAELVDLAEDQVGEGPGRGIEFTLRVAHIYALLAIAQEINKASNFS